MAATLQETLNEVSDMTNQLLREVWTDAIINNAFDPDRSWFMSRVPRNSDDVKGLTVHVPFLTRIPGGWRGMDAQSGYTPSGAPFQSDEQEWTLKASASALSLSLAVITAGGLSWNALGDMINRQLSFLPETFKYYLRGLLWSSYDPDATVNGVLGVIDDDEITTSVQLGNEGLWTSGNAADYANLFEPGMYISALDPDSGAAQGDPHQVIDVDKVNGILTMDSVDGWADDDLLVFSDISGLETGGADEFPGILDVIDDGTNTATFQGVDRTSNGWAQAYIEDADGVIGYDVLRQFLGKVYNPKEAFTHDEVVDEYYQTLSDQVRYTAGGEFVDGWQSIKVANTRLVGDFDCPRDRVIVPDFENMHIAQVGEMQNLFGKGWQQIAGRPVIEYVVVWWGRLVAESLKKMGVLYGIDRPS